MKKSFTPKGQRYTKQKIQSIGNKKEIKRKEKNYALETLRHPRSNLKLFQICESDDIYPPIDANHNDSIHEN